MFRILSKRWMSFVTNSSTRYYYVLTFSDIVILYHITANTTDVGTSSSADFGMYTFLWISIWTNSRKDEEHGVSPVKNSATIYFIICNPNNCPVKVKFYIIHIAYINFMQHGHSQTPSVHHCLQVLIDNNGDKFIRRSNICMSQFKLMVLVSNYIAKPKPLKCKQTWANVCYNTRK